MSNGGEQEGGGGGWGVTMRAEVVPCGMRRGKVKESRGNGGVNYSN